MAESGSMYLNTSVNVLAFSLLGPLPTHCAGGSKLEFGNFGAFG